MVLGALQANKNVNNDKYGQYQFGALSTQFRTENFQPTEKESGFLAGMDKNYANGLAPSGSSGVYGEVDYTKRFIA